MSHTPGPWSVPHFARDDCSCDCGYVLADGFCGSVASVSVDNGKLVGYGGNDSPPLSEAKANARLIAAAPEILAALQLFTKSYVDLIESGDCGCWDADGHDCVIAARAAIAKATA